MDWRHLAASTDACTAGSMLRRALLCCAVMHPAMQFSATDYLETALMPVAGSGAAVEAKNGIRSSIKSLFPDRDCATLVRPMHEEEVRPCPLQLHHSSAALACQTVHVHLCG